MFSADDAKEGWEQAAESVAACQGKRKERHTFAHLPQKSSKVPLALCACKTGMCESGQTQRGKKQDTSHSKEIIF